MKKIRIIGLVLLIIGVLILTTVENDLSDFISGLLIGCGLGFLITGKLISTFALSKSKK